MGIFDALFGTKTTGATDAATAAANGLINSTATGTNADLTNSATNALGDLNTGAAGATDALNTNYGSATGALASYGGQAQNTLATGVGNAVNTVIGSNAAYQPYVANGGAASNLYADSLGVNGAAGNAAATSAFQASPGYAFQQQQSTDQAARKAASLGIAGSGNTLDAITRLSSNLADQEYSKFQTNLQGLGSQGLTAANSISANNLAAGGYQSTGAATGANLLQQTGSSTGQLDALLGNQLGTVQTGLGTNSANIQTGLGNSLTNNAWNATNAINKNSIADANAQDTATNANSGIFSQLIGQVTGLPFGGVASSGGGLFSKITGLKL